MRAVRATTVTARRALGMPLRLPAQAPRREVPPASGRPDTFRIVGRPLGNEDLLDR